MLARLRHAFTPTTAPSVILAIGTFNIMVYFIHLIPEDGTIETLGCGCSATTTFRYHGTTEQARQQIGSVTIRNGDGEEDPFDFLDAVATRARKLWNDSSPSSLAQLQTGNVELEAATRLAQVEDVLRRAALDTLRDREELPPSMNATKTYPVFIIHVKRPRAGKILPAQPISIL
ncbi:hypothetical protein LXA43DRAFT_458788 [Ganoderma leucocontextum]|nr:hypothetical protein LXA43DRAFT_458788 [Ganoderma leucocontextum]